MPHFAKINNDNIVIDVLVNDNTSTEDINIINNDEYRWIETSHDHTIRKNYARAGYSYNEYLDAFIAPKSFESWTLDENTCRWISPIPYPQDGRVYEWNEQVLSWQEQSI